MTTNDESPQQNLERLNANLARVEDLSQRLIRALTARQGANPDLSGPTATSFSRPAPPTGPR